MSCFILRAMIKSKTHSTARLMESVQLSTQWRRATGQRVFVYITQSPIADDNTLRLLRICFASQAGVAAISSHQFLYDPDSKMAILEQAVPMLYVSSHPSSVLVPSHPLLG